MAYPSTTPIFNEILGGAVSSRGKGKGKTKAADEDHDEDKLPSASSLVFIHCSLLSILSYPFSAVHHGRPGRNQGNSVSHSTLAS